MDTSAGGTLVLDRAQVSSLATPRDYLGAVESAFRALAAGTMRSAAVAHVPGCDGGFHIKAAAGDAPARVAIKVNGNFPLNPARHGLPTIQGVLILSDAQDGRLLALMDSGELTARRTAAASALAARLLATPGAARLGFIGAGVQAHCHLDALMALDDYAFSSLACFDNDPLRAEALCRRARALGLDAATCGSAAEAASAAQVVVTSTPSRLALLDAGDIMPGGFVAAVGADHAEKQELSAALLARAAVVTDLTAQAATIGDLHHAIAAGLLHAGAVRAELGEVVGGLRPGRRDREEIVVFDSTGVAATDLAAASMLYDRALAAGAAGRRLDAS